MRPGLVVAGLLHVALMMGLPRDAAAQQDMIVPHSNVLVLDTERLLNDTLFGQRIQAELQAERDEIIAHNRRVEAELEAEEGKLTALRPTMPVDAFRDLADAFDEKVQNLRLESEQKSRELERRREIAPIQFLRVVDPVMKDLLRETGAVVVLDTRSVLMRTDAADVTALAIKRINDLIGEGPPMPWSETGTEGPTDASKE